VNLLPFLSGVVTGVVIGIGIARLTLHISRRKGWKSAALFYVCAMTALIGLATFIP
jgi:hypothetical protein